MSDADPRAVQRESFGAAAGVYERGRPGYPEAALDWLLPAGSRQVLDLGAGTGKLTRQLTTRGLDVVAVEPSEGMRAVLTRVLPTVRTLAGSAEAIPLPDDSVDTVLVAQAWHWVDLSRAVPEVARVLRPGGRLGLVWNSRDGRVDWVNALGRILAGGVEHMDPADPMIGSPFGPIAHFGVEWVDELTPEELLDLVASRSYIISGSPERRTMVMDEVRHLIASNPALRERETLAMPYVSQCSRAHLP